MGAVPYSVLVELTRTVVRADSTTLGFGPAVAPNQLPLFWLSLRGYVWLRLTVTTFHKHV